MAERTPFDSGKDIQHLVQLKAPRNDELLNAVTGTVSGLAREVHGLSGELDGFLKGFKESIPALNELVSSLERLHSRGIVVGHDGSLMGQPQAVAPKGLIMPPGVMDRLTADIKVEVAASLAERFSFDRGDPKALGAANNVVNEMGIHLARKSDILDSVVVPVDIKSGSVDAHIDDKQFAQLISVLAKKDATSGSTLPPSLPGEAKTRRSAKDKAAQKSDGLKSEVHRPAHFEEIKKAGLVDDGGKYTEKAGKNLAGKDFDPENETDVAEAAVRWAIEGKDIIGEEFIGRAAEWGLGGGKLDVKTMAGKASPQIASALGKAGINISPAVVSGLLGSVAKIAGPIGIAYGLYRAADSAAGWYGDKRQEGYVTGAGGTEAFAQGMQMDMQGRMLAISPFLDDEQAREIVKQTYNRGFKGKEAETVMQYAANNFKEFGLDVSKSMDLYSDSVRLGTMSISEMEVTLGGLRDATKDSNKSFEDMISTFEAFKESALGFGLEEREATVLSQVMTAGMGAAKVGKEMESFITGQAGSPDGVLTTIGLQGSSVMGEGFTSTEEYMVAISEDPQLGIGYIRQGLLNMFPELGGLVGADYGTILQWSKDSIDSDTVRGLKGVLGPGGPKSANEIAQFLSFYLGSEASDAVAEELDRQRSPVAAADVEGLGLDTGADSFGSRFLKNARVGPYQTSIDQLGRGAGMLGNLTGRASLALASLFGEETDLTYDEAGRFGQEKFDFMSRRRKKDILSDLAKDAPDMTPEEWASWKEPASERYDESYSPFRSDRGNVQKMDIDVTVNIKYDDNGNLIHVVEKDRRRKQVSVGESTWNED